MDIALTSVAIAALIVFIILAIYAIVSLSSLKRLFEDTSSAMGKISKDVDELKNKMIVSLNLMDETTKQIAETTKCIEDDFNEVFDIFKPFKSLANELYYKIAPPILQAVNYVSATQKAISVFLSFFTKKEQ
ncbi:MAG: DUF948 domain-containing protein [Bacteroidota bacterium]|jgi:uncharacterized protein YoxC